MHKLIFIITLPLLAVSSIFTGSSVFASTSYDNRETGKIGVGLGLGDFLSPVSGMSGSVFYNLSPDLQLELRGASGDVDAKDLVDSTYNTVSVNTLDLSASLYELRAKYFVGNSFYLAGGLGQRNIKIDIDARDSVSRINGSLESNAFCMDLGIGNIWTLDNGIYIGAEWLALSIPLSSTTSNSLAVSGISDQDTDRLKADTNSAMNKLNSTTTAGLLTFQIGYQF